MRPDSIVCRQLQSPSAGRLDQARRVLGLQRQGRAQVTAAEEKAIRKLSGRKGRKTPEGNVQDAVIEYLTLVKGWRVFRRNVGAAKLNGGYWVKFNGTGQADLWGWIPGSGRHFEIEVKKPGEKPEGKQPEWLDGARTDGCIAFWVDSIEMLEQEIAAWRL